MNNLIIRYKGFIYILIKNLKMDNLNLIIINKNKNILLYNYYNIFFIINIIF